MRAERHAGSQLESLDLVAPLDGPVGDETSGFRRRLLLSLDLVQHCLKAPKRQGFVAVLGIASMRRANRRMISDRRLGSSPASDENDAAW